MVIASRKVSGRALSTITTKPSIPSARISHMKSKRRWPGVPNRYSTRSSSTVMRPKSIATVVCSLTPNSSEPAEIVSSVETTSISLIDRINSVLPALNGPVTTIFTVWIGMSDLTLRCYKALNLQCDKSCEPAADDERCRVKRLAFFDPRDQALDHATLDRRRRHNRRCAARYGGRLLRGRRLHPRWPDQLNQPCLQQPIDNPPDLSVGHVTGFGDLADRVLRVDIRNDAPFLNAKMNPAELLARGLRESERHVEVWQFLFERLDLLGAARPLDDHVFEIDRDGDAVRRRREVFLERERLALPGHHVVDDINRVLLDAAHDVGLGHVVGVDQHQRQRLVRVFRAALADDARLLGVELARFVQHVGQVAVLIAHRRQDQLPLTE